MEETVLTIKKQFVKRYKNGYPLIFEDAIEDTSLLKNEGQVITLVDNKNTFLGKGYYGKQNKGCGWVLNNSPKSSLDYKLFYDKLKNALIKRDKFYFSKTTTAFRVFNGEGDGIGGLTIDFFSGFYLITWYSKGIYAFKDLILKTLKSLVPFFGIYDKKRFDENGMVVDENSYVCGRKAPEPLIIKENNVNFAVYLNDGAMVGIFLDQKEVRNSLKNKYSKGKTVLNTFSYTGAFSMAAAKGGAITTSVDLANRSLDKTIENFQLNKIDYKKHNIIVDDIFSYFKYAQNNNLKFDVVILDPPSFSTSKNKIFSANKDYKDLVKLAIDVTQDNGVILASTNCALFDMKKFKEYIDTAFKESHKFYEILEEHTLPKDFTISKNFPEGDYLKVLFIKIKN